MKVYWVTVAGVVPKDSTTIQGKCLWYLDINFPTADNAIDAAEAWVKLHPKDHVDVVVASSRDHANAGLSVRVWCSKDWPLTTHEKEGEDVGLDQYSTPEIAKPLNIERDAVVTRLQENLDAEVKERQDLEARERSDRITVVQFVTDHEDEIVEWIGRSSYFCGGPWAEVAKQMARFFEDNDYKPKSAKKSKRETDLEKFVRVLSMATDKTIEVQPHQPIYELL